MTSLTPQQAQAQRERAWRTDERKAVIAAASGVSDRARNPSGEDAPAAEIAALTSHKWDVVNLFADLIDAQREAERHHGDDRDGNALLAAWVEALRKPRDEAKAAALALEKGDPRRGPHVRRANAHTWAIKALIAAGEAEITTVRREIAETREWLGSPSK